MLIINKHFIAPVLKHWSIWMGVVLNESLKINLIADAQRPGFIRLYFPEHFLAFLSHGLWWSRFIESLEWNLCTLFDLQFIVLSKHEVLLYCSYSIYSLNCYAMGVYTFGFVLILPSIWCWYHFLQVAVAIMV